MEYLKVIAFTHHHIDLKSLGKLVICDQSLDSRLKNIQTELPVSEIFYIGTCNRVEFVFLTKEKTDKEFVTRFLTVLDMGLPAEFMERFLDNVTVYENEEAFNHLLRTSCSLESLVVGEKEILAQIRRAYENCRDAGFTGDYMRMIMERVVKTAKEVYTHTNISKNPVSVVSLAYRKLKELNMCGNSRVLIIGAGETNQNIAKYLNKHKYSNFSVFNRTLAKAESLAEELNGNAYPLTALEDFKEGFDVIITCTGSTETIIDEKLYAKLLNGDTSKKVIVDLAIPNDVAPAVIHHNLVHYIEVESLKEVARKNIQERYNELVHAEDIISNNITEFFSVLKQRRIEIAMQEVPRKIKEIKNTAINGVFAEEISQMDEASREVLERVMNYMEKKYISVPMVMAKEILVNQS
ncbi:glutamyl-tRNA reductase [Pedobacter sp. HDW13]|uniref:glutamyl-tRNA reductase n=1 Tax=unclassified Pedobacter TaxID=2628915 RepID=UPI000F5A9D6E|nr:MULTISPECIES: glutamyl-tRNA reductase [unclassified Pedobacter]QIL38665.1 glutamyl-tRNA reductase [Pedobacter sp. HDW13]RQO80173.1 glutamyl-tRNA reductase [Pedobacter sp. KBW01]